MTAAGDLLPHALGKALLADSAYDADGFVREIRRAGMKPVIPCNPTRKRRRRRLDKKLYRYRYLVEVFFHQIKRCRNPLREDRPKLPSRPSPRMCLVLAAVTSSS